MYKFPLSAVLSHKKLLEERLQKELGILKKVLVDERKLLSDLKRHRKQFSIELQKKQQESITISETLLYVRFIEQLSTRSNYQKERALTAESKVGCKRAEMIDAVKNRILLDKLNIRYHNAYKQRRVKQELDFLNEIASIKFNTKLQD